MHYKPQNLGTNRLIGARVRGWARQISASKCVRGVNLYRTNLRSQVWLHLLSTPLRCLAGQMDFDTRFESCLYLSSMLQISAVLPL